jgi:hypothetical protein
MMKFYVISGQTEDYFILKSQCFAKNPRLIPLQPGQLRAFGRLKILFQRSLLYLATDCWLPNYKAGNPHFFNGLF